MKRIKIADAPNRVIDWLVAKAEFPGRRIDIGEDGHAVGYPPDDRGWFLFKPTTDPAQAWPIIERERIVFTPAVKSTKWMTQTSLGPHNPENKIVVSAGPTSLVAAMRCYCASVYGEEAEVPEELLT